MGLLSILFLIAAIVICAVVLFGMLDAHVMPFSCPSCSAGGNESLAGQPLPWYRRDKRGVRCRICHAKFREHPNGSLVADRDL